MTAAPRRSRSILLLGLLTLSACGGGGTQPQPLPQEQEPQTPTLQGRLTLPPDGGVNTPVRLALAWYPTLLSESGPLTMPRGIATQSVTYSGSFPASYTFALPSAPPSEALVQLGNGMQGKGAVGVLLAYHDRNGNAALDTIPADGTPVDRVLGASLAWTQPPAYMVLYLDSAQAPSTGLKQGYNLVRLTDNLSSDVVPLTTSIPMRLSNDPLLDAFVCEAAWDDTAEQAPCGLPGDEPEQGALTLAGELSFDGAGADVSLDVRRDGMPEADAAVTVEGHAATYDAAQERYTLHLDDASALLESGLVNVTVRDGNEEAVRTVVVPGDFRVTWPTAPMSYSPGEAVHAAWTPSQGASRYEVSVVAGGQVLASAVTGERSLRLTPPAHEGAAVLRVEVVSEPVENEGFTVRRTLEVPLAFTPCDTVTEGSGLTVEGWLEHYSGDLEWETSGVQVEVKDAGVHVTDARVVLRGWDVPYMETMGAYHNELMGPPGSGLGGPMQLRVMRQGEVLCRTLTPPGDFGLTLDGQPERPTGSPLAVRWTRAQDAVWYELRLGETLDQPLYSAGTNELEYTFEQVDHTGYMTLKLAAVSHPAHNDTLGWMDVKRVRLGGAVFTE